ncbi:amidohydrolase family protein [Streptomyces sp. NPDC097610]|uniref:amidohydrolase family protein n=1 Tax=Streptomyces sp. NPDC097610 TaxID=3157227 RepID=UPI003325F6DC
MVPLPIDVHAHLWTAGYLDRLERLGKTDTGTQRGIGADATAADLDRRFALMDRAGIGLQVLSVASQSPHLAGESDAVALAGAANESYAELAARFPGRFRIFAALPLPHIDAALRELTRAFDDLGAVGIGVPTTVLGRTLADPLFHPLYEELDRRGAVLYIHYIHPAGEGAASPLITEHAMTWMVGAPIEDTVAVMHLILAGIPPHRGPAPSGGGRTSAGAAGAAAAARAAALTAEPEADPAGAALAAAAAVTGAHRGSARAAGAAVGAAAADPGADPALAADTALAARRAGRAGAAVGAAVAQPGADPALAAVAPVDGPVAVARTHLVADPHVAVTHLDGAELATAELAAGELAAGELAAARLCAVGGELPGGGHHRRMALRYRRGHRGRRQRAGRHTGGQGGRDRETETDLPRTHTHDIPLPKELFSVPRFPLYRINPIKGLVVTAREFGA